MGALHELAKEGVGVGVGICMAATGPGSWFATLSGAAITVGGIAAIINHATRHAGPDCDARLRRLADQLSQQLISLNPAAEADYEAASHQLRPHLGALFPTPESFAEIVMLEGAQRGASVEKIIERLRSRGYPLDGDGPYERLARDLARLMLELAYVDAAYFRDALQPYMLREIAVAVARANTKLDDIGERLRFEPALDSRNRAAGAGGRLFFFGADDRIPFFGRKQERKRLRQWAFDDQAFSWALVVGPGGVGKSRLAFELMHEAKAKGWSAGFLGRDPPDSKAITYTHFAPSRPTLIILDYAAERPRDAGEILRAIKRRGTQLEHPVRLLLLEREGPQGQWWPDFVGGQGEDMEGALGAELTLGDPGDHTLYEILSYAAKPANAPPLGQALSELRAIDKRGRPLFAALAGVAIKNGQPMGELSKQALLNDVLRREEQRWRSAAKGGEPSLQKHKNAVALATMVGGLALPYEAEGLDPRVFPFAQGEYDAALIKEITGRSGEAFVAPMEPDILGEWFVLQHLTLSDFGLGSPWDAFSRPLAALVVAAHYRLAASAVDASAFAFFLDRLPQDFPEDAFGSGLYKRPPASTPIDRSIVWAAGAMSAIGQLAPALRADDAEKLDAEIRALAEEQGLVSLVASGSANLVGAYCAERRFVEAEERCAELIALMDAHTDVQSIADSVALARSCLVMAYAAVEQLDLAQAHYTQLVGLVRSRSGNPDIAQYAAIAAINLINAYAHEQIDKAEALYAELREMVAPHGDRSGLAVQYAKATFNMGNSYANCGRVSDAEARYIELQALVARHRDSAEIAVFAAQAAFNLMYDDVEAMSAERAEARYAGIRSLNARHPDHADIAECVARGGYSLFVLAARTGNLDKATQCQAELRTLGEAYPSYQAIFDIAVRGSLQLIDMGAAAGRLALVESAFFDVQKLARLNPDMASGGDAAVKAIFATIPAFASPDRINDAQARYIQLRRVARDSGDPSELILTACMAAGLVSAYGDAGQVGEAEARFAELKALAADYEYFDPVVELSLLAAEWIEELRGGQS